MIIQRRRGHGWWPLAEQVDMTKSTIVKRGSKSGRNGSSRKRKTPNVERVMADGKAIDRAINRGIRDALLQHKRAGNPIAAWANGKVVWIKPQDIPV